MNSSVLSEHLLVHKVDDAIVAVQQESRQEVHDLVAELRLGRQVEEVVHGDEAVEGDEVREEE